MRTEFMEGCAGFKFNRLPIKMERGFYCSGADNKTKNKKGGYYEPPF
jgi:hypothetical protein